jgi:hypothetical protein
MLAFPAAAGAAAALLGAAAAPARAAVVAYPLPGTTTASKDTQISFRGAAPAALGGVTVRGSRSGRHRGRLRAHSDGQGASFLPARAFTPGERVTVRARGVRYGFAIGRRPAQPRTRPGERSDVGRGAVQRFASRPELAPPAVTVDTRADGRAPGLIFLAAKHGRGQDGPMIVDDFGRLVWFNAIGNRELATDFRVQSYLGRPVLTWWQGRLAGGHGRGEGVIYDTSYRPVRRVRAGNGFAADEHEFEITPQGTALLIIYDAVRRDISSAGARGYPIQAVLQEVDIATGLVLFEWHSLGNIGLSESHGRKPRHGGAWDYVHANSVALDADGDFILSSRLTSTVYKISRRTGRILWRLGGERSDFRLGPGASFYNQHDARPQPDGTLTLFDNGYPLRKRSRALTLALDTRAMTATVRSALTHPTGLLASTQGGVQRLPNGNTFVGWGSRRIFTEYAANGNVVLDGRLAVGGDSYRAYRFPWTALPDRPPAAVLERAGGRVSARVSWNGATGVARWELWAGASASTLTRLKGVPSAGFETAISAPTTAALVAVRAYDSAGKLMGTSRPAKPPAG